MRFDERATEKFIHRFQKLQMPTTIRNRRKCDQRELQTIQEDRKKSGHGDINTQQLALKVSGQRHYIFDQVSLTIDQKKSDSQIDKKTQSMPNGAR